MERKYYMTREENIFVAKRNIVDYIWKSARLEGLGVTYPDTDAIFNGMSVPDIKVDEIIAVNNLKHAWQFLLNNLDVPADYSYICYLNRMVGGDSLILNAGYVRKIAVSIGGTTWKPDIPDEDEVKMEILEILDIEDATDKAITLMLYLMRKQLFIDGNKRTSMLAGNQVMISNGCGIISVPIECQREFKKLLVQFYESGNMDEIKAFVYENCIDGIDFRLNEKLLKKEQEEKGLTMN